MGRGPEHLVENGLPQILQAEGHKVSVETIEATTEFRAEVKTQFELYRLLAGQVAEAKGNGQFPLVLSGNCGASVGVIAGAGTKKLGVIWFDSHGEFNTPETTTSGFLDGMGLAVSTGLCWKRLAASIPNFSPIPGGNILLVGGRDFDEGEKERLEQEGVMVVDAVTIGQSSLPDALNPRLSMLREEVEDVHLHIDLDVLNPKEAPANAFVTEEGGLGVVQLAEAIKRIKENFRIVSATIASYDPSYDSEKKTLHATFNFIEQIIGR